MLSQDAVDQMMSFAPGGSSTSSDQQDQSADAAVARAFAPQSTAEQNLQQSVAYGATQDPDQYANLLRLKQQTGVAPQLAQGYQKQLQQSVDKNSIDYPQFVANSPRTASWASQPDNAAVSGVSEIQRLAEVERLSRFMGMPGLTPGQQQAVLSDRARVAQQNDGLNFAGKTLGEANSAAANTNAGFASPFLSLTDAVGAGVQSVLESGKAILSDSPGTGGDIASDLHDIWLTPRTFAVQKYVTNPVRDWFSASTRQGPQKTLTDPTTGKTFQNPDHVWYGRDLANTLEGVPGTLAAFALTGKAAGGVEAAAGAEGAGLEAKAVPALLGSQAAQNTYADARSKGADQKTAVLAALASSLTTYGMMGEMPGGVPTSTFGGAAAQWAGRSAAMGTGLAVADNTIARTYDPNRGMLEGVPQSIATMAAFEGVGALSNITDLVAESKLRARSPEKFQESLQAVLGDDPSLRIPVDQFNSSFKDKGVDPAAVADQLGSTNYAEAHLSGGDVEIPPASFFGKLDPEHQKALLPDVVEPTLGRTIRQDAEYKQELQQWATGGGAAKLAADTAAADAETAATETAPHPEFSQVKDDLLARHVAAGETPEKSEALAAIEATDLVNASKHFQTSPLETLATINPHLEVGEAPEGDTEHASVLNQHGDFGPVHDEFHHDAPGAIKQLLADKDGEAVAALHHPDVGDIDLVYGKEGTAGKNYKDGYGLAKIASKHPEMLQDLQGSLDGMHVITKSENRIRLGDDSRRAVVSLSHFGKEKKWLLTAFQNDEKAMPAAEGGRMGVTNRAESAPHPADQEADKATESVPPVSNKNIPKVESPEDGTGENPTLFQTAEDGQRKGWFRVRPDGEFEIGTTKIGNLGTKIHEFLGHGYLEMLRGLFKSRGDQASDQIKADRDTILDFLGAKDLDSITPEQHEKFANVTEQYLREGKVPNPDMREVFQKISLWLRSIVSQASARDIEISPEMRAVLDRRFAAEDSVNRAETETGPRLFNSPEEAGWTPEQFQKYADDNNMSAEQAKSDIVGRMNEATMRERTETWREEEKNVRAAVTTDVDQRPEYSAIRSLRKGALDNGAGTTGPEITMSRDELVKQFGEERVKELQKLHPGLYRNEGGGDPEIVAEVFGFHSAAEMMKALEATPRRSAAIEAATREYMTAKHGDIRYDGSLNDQARIALENDKRAEGLYAELKALKQKAAQTEAAATGRKEAMRSIEVAPLDAYRESAHQMVEKKSPADLQPTRYLNASLKYGRETFNALRRGDARAAGEAKHKELLNHFLFREATKAKEYVTKFEAYAKRAQKPAVQSKLGLAGGDFQDQFNRILGRYALGPRVGLAERTLSEWAAAQYESGKEPAIDASILNEARTVNYRNAPVAEIRQVHDALINVKKLAYQELEMTVNGKKIEFQSAVTDMAARARESLKSTPTRVLKRNATVGEWTGDKLQRGAALMKRTEFLMHQLDGGAEGPWHDNLWYLAADAQGSERALQEGVVGKLNDLIEARTKEQRDSMLNKVEVDGIPETVTRRDLVSMAFNMGNDGNLDRLEKSFDQFSWDRRAIDRIRGGGDQPSMLTRDEWQFIQNGWDMLKPLGAAEAEMEKRVTGLPPMMVRPTPFDVKLADGTSMHLEGGYYTISMDPRFSTHGALQDSGTTSRNLMEAGYTRASTSRSAMKQRTGFGGPLEFNYEQILTQHIAKVSKDISHREFMLAANKLLMHPAIRQTLRETLGEGYEEQMMPWLRTLVNDRNGSAVQGLDDLSKALGKLRSNYVTASLCFKASTALLQLTHASSIFLHTSPGSYATALVKFLARPSEITQEIRDQSPNEMRHRGENLDRDMRSAMQDSVGKQSVGTVMARAGMFPVKLMDHLLSFPLWDAVYQDALLEHVKLPEGEAKYLAMHKADGAVRMGLGANAPKDLPPIMRKNDFTKAVTMLGGFHNLKWNQIAGVAGDFKRNGSYAKLAYGATMAAIIPAVLGAYTMGKRPKDDENPGEWAAKRALLFAPETIPLIGDGFQGVFEGEDPKYSPLVNMIDKGIAAGRAAGSDKEDKDWTGIGINASEFGGEFFGVPGTTQAIKTARYAHRAQMGEIDDPNAWDAVVGTAHK